jgi:MOSC domain-containing protein YiiM
MVKLFFESRRTGFYVAVTREGEVGAGDAITRTARGPEGVSVADITRLYAEKRYSDADLAVLRRALKVTPLPESWKEYFRERLGRIPTPE